MTYRAVLPGAGLLIVFASCGAPDGNSLFRSYIDAPGVASSGSSGAAGAAAGGSGGAASAGAQPSGATDGSEGPAADIGLVAAGGSAARPLTTDMSPGENAPAVADAGEGGVADAGAAVDAAPPPPPPCGSTVELCDGLDNDCDGAVDEGGACAPDCAGFALVDRGYMFCSTSVERDVAADRCELEGMRLAWIETAEENDFLVDSIAAADVPAVEDDEVLTYIGASDSGNEGNWIWRGRGIIADGFQFWQGANFGNAVNGAFESWSPGEPNNTDDDENCAALSVLGSNNRAPGSWDDRDCDSELPFVCEVP